MEDNRQGDNSLTDNRLTLEQWRMKARWSVSDLARAAEIDYRTAAAAEIPDRPVRDVIISKIIGALQERFKRYPEYAEGLKIPEFPKDIKDIVIYDASIHRAPRGSKKKLSSSQEA
ncbi:hypothetical protein EI42_05971 [Thermosporothrix hazakensis]|jgi:hypothetical protein|uniref:Uncharacterized protein n=1 Tax=Thermosporothrix hazakensis TaxID=644383 RepID=A0A326TT14_THEHA|nr:hypothetical protein [Thermosporothrix hazakensis]PZW19662.1 hypothetical protein EI42_05971 [Thermosporothrix hazakensis]GCE49226.1 hypothetical protein KTH_40950 [Thermosporothrix hazakensis]